MPTEKNGSQGPPIILFAIISMFLGMTVFVWTCEADRGRGDEQEYARLVKLIEDGRKK